jgi:prepilin-type N-terminal cleavage/methylation domain-containing protein
VGSFRRHRRDLEHPPRRGRGDQAFTLVEVMVAMVILAVTMLPLGYVVTSIFKQSSEARNRIAAVGVAEHWLAYYDNLALSDGSFPIPNGSVVKTATTPIGGTNFTANITMQWGQTGVNGDLCNAGSVPQIINVLAAVTWGQNGSVQESTVVNPPYGLLSPTDGFLAVQVNNSAGVGQSHTPPANPINVALTPSPGIGTAPTTVPDGGCVFLAANSGSYRLTLSSPTSSPYSFVDSGENTTTFLNVTVLAEATVNYTVAYDQGGAINVSYASQTSLADGVVCPTATSCYTWGRETQGALVLADNSGSWSSLPFPAGVITGVTGIACLTSGTCVITGFGPGTGGVGSVGVMFGLSGGILTPIPVPTGVTSTALTGVTCPATSTTCVVTGNNGGTSGVLLSTNGSVATNVLPAITGTTIVSVSGSACSSATQCYAVGTGTSGLTRVGVILSGSGSTWAAQTVPGSVTAISSVSCSLGATAMCTAAVSMGSTQSLLSTTTNGATWSLPTTAVAAGVSIGPLWCTQATTCLASAETASGSTTTAGVAVSSNGGATWAVPSGFPTNIGAINSLTCSSSTQCMFSGSNTTGAVVDVSANGGATWTSQSLPIAASFASGSGCATTSNCLVAGETPTGPVAFTTTTGGVTWTQASGASPAGIGGLTGTGLIGSGLPLAYSQSVAGTLIATPYTTPGASDASVIPNLFPFVGATGATYSAWAGDCTTADQPAASTLSSTLVTSGHNASVTVPLSYLAVRVVDGNGQPIAGATVTAEVTTATCNQDVFDLPASQGDGRSEAALLLGNTTPLTYTLTVTSGALTSTTNITVSSTGVLDNSTGVSYPYPLAVPVVP